MEGTSWKTMVSEKDRVVVDELRKRMAGDNVRFGKPELDTDVHIARFARARKHYVESAWEMLKANVAWRAEHKVDTIHEWAETETGRELIAFWPNQPFGRTRTNMPLVLEHMVMLDPVEVFERFTPADLMQLHLYCMERELQSCYTMSEELGRPVTEIVVVQNCAGLGMHHLHQGALDLVRELLAVDEANYPEFAGALLVINAPLIFPLIYKMVRPFIDPITVSKIRIFSSSAWSTSPDFLEHVTLDLLPPQWGGTAAEEWARSGALARPEDEVEEKKFSVPASGKHAEVVEVEQDGSTLVYQFTTAAHDIGFTVESLSGKRKKTLTGPTRVNSHEEAVTGMFPALKKGSFQLVFDNSYSWATSKDVSLVLSVRPPRTKAEKRKDRRKKREEKKKSK